MKKILLSTLLIFIAQAFSAEVVLERDGVTLTDEEMLAAASDLSAEELKEMKKNTAMLRTFIEKQFDNKVMNTAIMKELTDDKTFTVLSAMNAANFANHYYIKQKALEKIDAVKDYKTLAKQTYHSNLKDYKEPQTYDYYHILFVKQEGYEAKNKAEQLKASIDKEETSIADAAKKYHSAVSGGDENGVMTNVVPKQLLEALQKAVFAMQEGDVSDVIETPVGYHIISLKQINKAKTKAFDVSIEQDVISGIKTKMYRATNKEIRDQYRGPEGLTVNKELLDSVSKQILSQ